MYLGVFRIQWYRICTCSLSVASRAIHEKEMVIIVALIQKKKCMFESILAVNMMTLSHAR